VRKLLKAKELESAVWRARVRKERIDVSEEKLERFFGPGNQRRETPEVRYGDSAQYLLSNKV
jgi:hypothetical protein